MSKKSSTCFCACRLQSIIYIRNIKVCRRIISFLVAFSINSLKVEKRVGKEANKHDGSFPNFEYDLNHWLKHKWMMLNHLPKYANQFVFILRNSIPMPLFLGSLANNFYQVKNGLSNITSKSLSKNLSNGEVFPENWHFNSCFVLKTKKTTIVCFHYWDFLILHSKSGLTIFCAIRKHQTFPHQ